MDKASGLRSGADGSLSVSGGGNNVQIAYLSEDEQNYNKAKYATFNGDKKLRTSNKFTAQYE